MFENPFQQLILGNSLSRWLAAAAFALLIWSGLALFKYLLSQRLLPRLQMTRPTAAKLIDSLSRRLRSWWIFCLAILLGLKTVELPQGLTKVVAGATFALVLLSLVAWVGQWLSHLLKHWLTQRLSHDTAGATMFSLADFVIKLLLWSGATLMLLDNLGVDVTALIAGLGIGGIAVALAAQNVLADFFASVAIVLDKPFVIGDFLTVGEFSGRIEQIGIKTTRLRSISGEQIIFSNTDLLASRVRNFQDFAERRFAFTLGVVYGLSDAKLRSIVPLIRALIAKYPKVRLERAHFAGFGESSLNFEVVLFVHEPRLETAMDVQELVLHDIYQALSQAKIDFAFPTRTVLLQQQPVL